jgi:glycosyltransferase involved in cell wall biosynthesis
MNIVFDNIIFQLQKRGGGSIYWSELISSISAKKNVVPWYLEGQNKNNIAYRNYKWRGGNLQNIRAPIVSRYLPVNYRMDAAHIFHSSYYRYSINRQSVNVTTVHDFIYEKYVGQPFRAIHHAQKEMSLRRSQGIICISENTKRDLLSYFPWIDESCIRVIYNGVSPVYKLAKSVEAIEKAIVAFGLNYRKYVLFVGHRSIYKNFQLAVSAVANVPNLTLVVVGEPLKDKERAMLDAGLKGRYVLLESASNMDLYELYNGAFCLLYPSSYEGFGIPIVEAMCCGCPVIANHCSSIPEVGGDALLYAENADVGSYTTQLYALMNEDVYSRYQSRGLERAKIFSWDKCIDMTFKFYQQLLLNI